MVSSLGNKVNKTRYQTKDWSRCRKFLVLKSIGFGIEKNWYKKYRIPCIENICYQKSIGFGIENI